METPIAKIRIKASQIVTELGEHRTRKHVILDLIQKIEYDPQITDLLTELNDIRVRMKTLKYELHELYTSVLVMQIHCDHKFLSSMDRCTYCNTKKNIQHG